MTTFPKRLIRLLILGLILSLIPFLPASPPARAQNGTVYVIDVVLRQFSNYMGINPALTAAELDRGQPDRPFAIAYRFNGVDLRDAPLSCTSRVMDETEVIIGNFGFEVIITMNRRIYRFRINADGSGTIRCDRNQQPLAFNGAPRGIGKTLTGDEATGVALRHISGYLSLTPVLTVASVNDPADDAPRVIYSWLGVVFEDASLGCPDPTQTYDVRDTFGYRITLNVNGIVYRYRLRGDGAVALLCIGGRPDASSLGATLGVVAPAQ